jgi:hypothetical protein
MRALTAIAVIGLCAFAAYHGWRIVGFAQARAHVLSGGLPTDALRPWIADAGLAGAALDTSLRQAPDAGDSEGLRRRQEGLAAILGIWPLSSPHWLSLAGLRLVAGAPYERVLAAFAMSWVTGPNEGSLMLQRGMFGLLQWEVLPPDARKRTIADVAGVMMGTPVQDVDAARVKLILAGKSSETKRELSDLLRAQGMSMVELARIGL